MSDPERDESRETPPSEPQHPAAGQSTDAQFDEEALWLMAIATVLKLG